MLDKSYYQLGEFTNKTPFIDFTDEPAIQCDIPIAQNTFVGDCK